MAEKQYKNKKYKPILPGTKDWPVVRLSKNRKQFIEQVAGETVRHLTEIHSGPEQLRELLETTVYLEKLRIKQNPWKVDPPDEMRFWNRIRQELLEISVNEESGAREKELLERIVARYTNEIAGNFKKSRYKMAREIIKFGFARLLNATRVKRFGAFFRNEYTLRDKIQITGKTGQLRKLARIGTVVMVPTHFSNLDSILIGWIIHSLGLPAFIYGAGLNLFNIKILAYFMNSLGAYKVDRRKKNPIYLENLKTYSKLAIEEGAHSLFFPGGTRSRSGRIETSLKRGLLGTAMEAQRSIYEKSTKGEPRKIFIVPVTLNYHFVLEAPSLINEFLKREGQEKYYVENDAFTTSYKMIKFLLKFFTKGSDISVSIGRGMDLMGNYVDKKGRSIDQHGRFINTQEYFMTNRKVCKDSQREAEYTRQLSEVIIREYHRINCVFSSHLVAFVAFNMIRKKYSQLDLYDLLRLPEEDIVIPYDSFREKMDEIRKLVFAMKEEGQVNTSKYLHADLDEVIRLGLENVGMYHSKRPLLKNKAGNIITQDLNTLYYYHNRMHGYDLERYF